MKKRFTTYQEKGLRILTVSVDRDPAQLQQLIDQQQVPYPVIPDSGQFRLPDLYESHGIPGYFLIDPHGVITGVWRGSVTETPQDLEIRVIESLGLTAPAPQSAAGGSSS